MMAPDQSIWWLRDAAARRLKGSPDVTIVVPVFNQIDVTMRCLKSILLCDTHIAIQIVIVDDSSTDSDRFNLNLPGIDVIRNGVNLGFVHSCNRGASIASGRLIWFLNNDTVLKSGSLSSLVSRIESDPSISIVGSKLIYPDGRLQEAGGIIWSDGSAWNYGRNGNADDPIYNYARDVDYVSGASLMVRSEVFREIGGFDERFAPGYYEDVDLCFAVRELAGRVTYEPKSVVVHYEGATSGTDVSAGMKRFQEINKPKLQAKWASVLRQDYSPPGGDEVERAARRRGGAKQTILVVDTHVPLYDREAGSNRLQQILLGLRAAATQVVMFPDDLLAMQPYAGDLQDIGIEVVYRYPGGSKDWREQFLEALRVADLVWICRPDLCKKYLPLVRENSSAPVIYDTVDLHHVRLRREAELVGNSDDREWQAMQELEFICAFASNGTVVVSEAEKMLLSAQGIDPICIIPTVHDRVSEGTYEFDFTEGILFIGGYNHLPNVDAAIWLVDEVMPLVRAQIPAIKLTLLGSDPPPQVRNLASALVVVPGYIHDVSQFFRESRLFVAPIRFGAGIKGKIGHALSFGLPIVTTPVGAEGFELRDGESVLIANDASAFASAIVRLHRDRELWQKLSAASESVLPPFTSAAVIRSVLEFIREVRDATPPTVHPMNDVNY